MSLRTSLDLLLQLRSGQRMLADGAVGSELLKSGIEPTRTVYANLSHPELVQALHRRAILAGADLITTNTFGIPTGEAWATAFQAGVQIADAAAREARPAITVMLSVYPTELLQQTETVFAPFRNARTQERLLLIETAVAIQEACASVRLARTEGIAVVAATCHFQPDGHMPDGTSPALAAALLRDAGASIVGGNCGSVPEEMVVVAEQMRPETDLPLLFQPNAGLPQYGNDTWIYPVDPDRFAANAARLFEVGVSLVGGCCGTTPAHIAAVRSLHFPQRRE